MADTPAMTEAEIRRHADNAARVAKKAKAAMAEGDSPSNAGVNPIDYLVAHIREPDVIGDKIAEYPEPSTKPVNLLPKGFEKNEPTQPDGPSKKFLDAMKPYMEEPKLTANAASVKRVTDALPGDVFGEARTFNQQVNASYLDPDQYERFLKAGRALVAEMRDNPKLKQALLPVLDLNGDGTRSYLEAGAYAAAIDEQRTFNRTSFEDLATQLGSVKLTARAVQISEAMQETQNRLPPDMRQPGTQGSSQGR